MFNWLSNLAGKQDESNSTQQPAIDLEAILRLEKAVLFKHSRSCPVSWAAATQVKRFQEGHPSVPVYTITVQQDRKLSNWIEEQTGIRHESPQVIIFRNGEAVANTSHNGVTEQYLAAMVA